MPKRILNLEFGKPKRYGFVFVFAFFFAVWGLLTSNLLIPLLCYKISDIMEYVINNRLFRL